MGSFFAEKDLARGAEIAVLSATDRLFGRMTGVSVRPVTHQEQYDSAYLLCCEEPVRKQLS